MIYCWFLFSVSPTQKYGVHGYDNDEELMHAMFFANGPVFTEQTVVPPFSSVDLFNVFCIILGIEAVPNNGTLVGELTQMLVGYSNVTIKGASTTASAGWSSGKKAGE